MAWRIDEQVVRGELDCRVRGRVTGRIWFVGRAEPVELELTGSPWRDLAGRRLEFSNPEPKPGDLKGLAPRQTGAVGDITASRKVKVPEIPLEQIGEYYAARKPWPWHWGNSLYLEWYSQDNGRVVVESASFTLTMPGEAAWEMTEAEEETQRKANAGEIQRFMERLGRAVAGSDEPTEETEKDAGPGEEEPFSEEEAEKIQEESDRLADRIQARMEKEGEGADYEKILEEELERRRAERGEKPLTPEEEAERAAWIDEMNRTAEEALDDPELLARVERKHPLAERAHELAVRLFQEPGERGWVPDEAGPEHPVVELMASAGKAGAKLAGALNGRDWPPNVMECGTCLVWLKRARRYLDDALLAVESCDEERLVDAAWLAGIRRELQEISAESDEIVSDLRDRLKRGFD